MIMRESHLPIQHMGFHVKLQITGRNVELLNMILNLRFTLAIILLTIVLHNCRIKIYLLHN